jgi:uncharacterized membrane protein
MSEGRREGGLLFERMVFFSDAVFAIAITLLVLDLKLPASSHGVVDFDAIGDKLFGFFLSFAVIGVYWLNHHRLFGTVKADDGLVRVVNLAFLASIVFLPFPTAVIAEFPATSSSVRFYAGSVCAVGYLLALLSVAVRRPSLLRPGETLGGTVRSMIQSLTTPTVFLVSVFVAAKDPRAAIELWWLITPLLFLAARIGRLIQRRIDRGRAPEPQAPVRETHEP